MIQSYAKITLLSAFTLFLCGCNSVPKLETSEAGIRGYREKVGTAHYYDWIRLKSIDDVPLVVFSRGYKPWHVIPEGKHTATMDYEGKRNYHLFNEYFYVETFNLEFVAEAGHYYEAIADYSDGIVKISIVEKESGNKVSEEVSFKVTEMKRKVLPGPRIFNPEEVENERLVDDTTKSSKDENSE
jgi:hypothetical protein